MSENVRECPKKPVSLTYRQILAIEGIVDGAPLECLEEELEISDRTLRRWRNIPEFQAEVNKRLEEKRHRLDEQTRRELRSKVQSLGGRAIEALWRELESKSDKNRMDAVMYVIKLLGLEQTLTHASLSIEQMCSPAGPTDTPP